MARERARQRGAHAEARRGPARAARGRGGARGGPRVDRRAYFHGRETRTAADGSFVLRGLAAGLCRLRANGGTNGQARTELELHAGEEARWDIVLTSGGVVAGAVLDERGAPLSHWHIAAVEHGDSSRSARTASCSTSSTTDGDAEDGRYTAWLGGLLPGSYSIEARAADGRSATGELHVLDLAADDTPLILTLR